MKSLVICPHYKTSIKHCSRMYFIHSLFYLSCIVVEMILMVWWSFAYFWIYRNFESEDISSYDTSIATLLGKLDAIQYSPSYTNNTLGKDIKATKAKNNEKYH